ncbi:MAG TPA: arylsulfatase [Geminicoccaceae bacterium]|nr:arylsulfatase [Geminicoccus sp.]HMU48391.1 arylsulfatase [Geminicoccaceae bacterium]
MKRRLLLSVATVAFAAILGTSTLAQVVTSSDAPPPPRSPDNPLVVRSEQAVEWMEPSIPRPEQERTAADKLAAFEQRTGRKPNILLLLVDDLGWGDVGAFGGGVALGGATPNIDALAANGLKLTSTYAQPTCTPTRSALITGRLPVRTGLTRPILATEKFPVNPWADEHSLAELLSGVGYRTALAGKWHVGEAEGMLPHEVGFDEFFGIGSVESFLSLPLPRREMTTPEFLNDTSRVNDYYNSGAIFDLIHGKKGQGQNFARVKPLRTAAALGELDQDIAQFSIDFIKSAAAENRPFFLNHSFVKVHYDNIPAAGFAGTSVAKTHYRDAVVEVDHIVGRLVAALREADQLDNTFIFFTSDNGPELDSWPDNGATPFRSGKGTTWEGGVRVPGIAAWNGMIKPEQVSDGMFDLTDFHVTALAFAGALDKQPSDKYVDGIDQSSFLLADGGQTKRHTTFFWIQDDFSAMRLGEFKFYFKPVLTPQPMTGVGGAQVIQTGTTPWAFNLYVDPQEQKIGTNYHYDFAFEPGVAESSRHLATFAKYPRKNLGLTAGR